MEVNMSYLDHRIADLNALRDQHVASLNQVAGAIALCNQVKKHLEAPEPEATSEPKRKAAKE